MSLWDWAAVVVPAVVVLVWCGVHVRLTGRPPADLYDALKDIAGGRK